MKYSEADWAVKRERGLLRYLLFDGILITGGPFAVMMQIAGYFIFPGDAQTFGQYFGSSVTWMRFFFHGTLFGLIMGFINWRRNERAFAKMVADGQK